MGSCEPKVLQGAPQLRKLANDSVLGSVNGV